MFKKFIKIISNKELAQLIRDERHKGITLGYQLAQSERTNRGSIYSCQGIQFKKPLDSSILEEVEQILEQKGF